MIGASLLGRRIGILVGLAQTVAAQQEDFGVFDEPVGDGGRDGRIKRMLPQSENGVLVVITVERLWLRRVEMT